MMRILVKYLLSYSLFFSLELFAFPFVRVIHVSLMCLSFTKLYLMKHKAGSRKRTLRIELTDKGPQVKSLLKSSLGIFNKYFHCCFVLCFF